MSPEQPEVTLTVLTSIFFAKLGAGHNATGRASFQACVGEIKEVLETIGDFSKALEFSELFGTVCVNWRSDTRRAIFSAPAVIT